MNKTVENFRTLPIELQLLLKETFKQGEWGDTTMNFYIDGKKEEVGAYGFCTNDVTIPSFSGRKKSAAYKKIYTLLDCDNNGIGQFVTHESDFWNDGSGDMLFIKDDDYTDVMKWAQKK